LNAKVYALASIVAEVVVKELIPIQLFAVPIAAVDVFAFTGQAIPQLYPEEGIYITDPLAINEAQDPVNE
jgi:hypothetical protein